MKKITRFFLRPYEHRPEDASHDHGRCHECKEIDLVLDLLPESRSIEELSLEAKYQFVGGRKILGRGATGVVRLATCQECPSLLVAIKEFRKRRREEPLSDYLRRLCDEYGIATSLTHENVCQTIDIVRHNHRWYEVMEYCEQGDMFAFIHRRNLSEEELDGCFKQLVLGVNYLHSNGIAHRDLKLENLLIDAKGTLKIADFGISEVFRSNPSDCNHKSRGLCGSTPYIAPEEYTNEEYDARQVDVWSMAIIYFAMLFHGVPWLVADPIRDVQFKKYMEGGIDAIEPFSRLPSGPRSLLRRMLLVDPAERITVDGILQDKWFRSLRVHQLFFESDGDDEAGYFD